MILFLLTRLLRGATWHSGLLPAVPGFLLTRLLRGATKTTRRHQHDSKFLLTRLLRGATSDGAADHRRSRDFYSHASCEARPDQPGSRPAAGEFLLTRLLRGATSRRKSGWRSCAFLLTRLLRGATSLTLQNSSLTLYFYSHASCEARLKACIRIINSNQFLLTRLLRGATSVFRSALR